MDRSSRRAGGRLRAMALVVVLAGLAAPTAATAQITTDLTDWNLTESTSTWGSAFHISSSGDGTAQYRWLDSPSKTTVISGNACPDLALYGAQTFGAGDTSYKTLFSGHAGLCFALRGRTAAGSGSMVNHDGRVKR